MIKKINSLFFLISFLFSLGTTQAFAAEQRIYDDANLLTTEQKQTLEAEAASYFDEWKTDFIIITTDDTQGKDIKYYMQDFTDELEKEFNREEDNMAVLAIDMKNRDFYLAGFGRGETYLSNERLDMINEQITPYLRDGNYFQAFQHFFEKSDKYLGVRPNVNPENIFFKTYFQIAIGLGIAGVTVFIMAYNSGGRVTVTSGTYLSRDSSRVLRKHDRFLRKTVTKRKKPSNNNSGGGGGFGGGGGGITGGGRSHSGSRGSF